MSFRYRNDLRQVVLLLVVGATLGAGGAAVASLREPDVFRSSITLLVTSAGADASPDADVQTARTFADLATTSTALQQAVAAGGASGRVSQIVAGADGLTPYVNVEVIGTEPRAVASVGDSLVLVLPDLARQLKQVSAASPSRLRSTGPASIPTGPESQGLDRATVNGLVVGALVGLAAGVTATAPGRRGLDEQAVAAATGLPVLTSVPRQHPRPRGGTDPLDSPRGDAWQRLATALQAGSPCAVLAITSMEHGEGRTSTTANLAIALAANGERVAVLDADSRRPALHTWFDVPRGPGLTEVLSGHRLLHNVVHVTESGVTLLPAGAAPSTPLPDGDVAALLARLRRSHDRVLLDVPPLLDSSSLSLGRHADGALLVARSRGAGVAGLRLAHQRMSRAGVTTRGLVVTDAHDSQQVPLDEVLAPRTDETAWQIDWTRR